MIEFKVEEIKYSMPTSWQEVNMRTFIRFQKIVELNTVLPLGDEVFLQQIFEALCGVDAGVFDDISYATVVMLNPHLEAFNAVFPTSSNTQWVIDGVTYTYHSDPHKYTLSEFGDIKTIQANSKANLEYLADIAAIMIRPAIKCLDEAGNEYYRLTKRSPVSQTTNKQTILNMNCVEVMTVVTFFLNTMNG